MHFFHFEGLKPGQRKVLFTCFKRNDKREVKVAQLAGSVAEMSSYHHGEVNTQSNVYKKHNSRNICKIILQTLSDNISLYIRSREQFGESYQTRYMLTL